MSGVYYKPYHERTSDIQYAESLSQILVQGIETRNPWQDKGTITCLTVPVWHFNLTNGFPVITERDVSKFWRRPIAELIAFIHGATTLEELERHGGKYWASWWKRWARPDKCDAFGLPHGDLGPGSYGAGFAKFPMPGGGTFNQFEHLIRQMKERPGLRTHKISPWIPFYTLQHSELQRKVVVAPCHGDLQITILENKLFLRMDQRSADVPIGVPSNMIQYAALTLMVAQVLKVEPFMFIHSLHDAQIYTDQVAHVEKLLLRYPRPFPTVRIIDESIDNIFDFRPEHFELSDYYPHPAMDDIPVTE